MSFKPRNFREWCNHTIPVLPQVYGDELSYYELLNKVVEKLNVMGITVNELIDYVNNYFDSKDWQLMVNNKLDSMVTDGTLDRIINQEIFGTLNNKVNFLEDNRKNFSGCKILCIGDSFGKGFYDGTDHLDDSWPSLLGLYAKGSIIYNYCVDGAGFVVPNNTYLTQLTSAKNEGHTDVDIVIIEGGHNDGYHPTLNLYQAMLDCIDYTKANFPKAILYVVAANSGTDEPISRETRHQVWKIMENACIHTGTVFYMLNIYMFISEGTLSSDGFHPSKHGYYVLSGLIYQMLIGLNFHIASNKQIGFNAEFNNESITYVNKDMWYYDAHYTTETDLDGKNVAFSFSVDFSENYANRESPLALHVPFCITNDGLQGTMIIRLRNGKMEMSPLAFEGQGAYAKRTGTKQFAIPPFTLTFPTIMIM